MAQPYSQTREVHLKLVFFGPAAAGKTSALNYLYRALRPDLRGQLVSVNTGADRTLFFDFYPAPPPRLLGVTLHAQIYTASGGIQNEATRRALLAGADGVLFIADSQRGREQDNIQALEQLRTCLIDLGQRLDQLPLVLAWNKRDLSNTLPIGELEVGLNVTQAPSFATVAEVGQGVFEAFRALASRALESALKRRPDALAGAAPRPDPAQPGDMVTSRRLLATQDAQRALLTLAARYAPEAAPTAVAQDNSALLRAAAMEALTSGTPQPAGAMSPAPSSQSVPPQPGSGSGQPRVTPTSSRSPRRPVSSRPMHVLPMRDNVEPEDVVPPSTRAATSSRRVLLPGAGAPVDDGIPNTGFAPSSGSGGAGAAASEVAQRGGSIPGVPSRTSKLSTSASESYGAMGREIFLSHLLPPGSLRAQFQDIERQLIAGQFAPAVRRAASLFYALTAAEATREPDEGPAWRGLVLGLPVDRYLRFRQAVQDAEVGKCTPEDGLFALFFLLDAVLRKEGYLARSA